MNAELKAKAYADALRHLADWFEAHPDVDTPDPELTCYSMHERDDAARVIRALGSCEKSYQDTLFVVQRKFGPISLRYMFMRDAVCVRKVVGHKDIPEIVIPATPKTVIPARTEEIVEWDCMPILADKAA